MNRLITSIALAGMFLVAAGQAQEGKKKHLANVDKSGVALQGACPVHLFESQKIVKGDKKFSSKHEGATYYFATEADKSKFEKAPSKYLPAYGGYCAFGVGLGKLFDVDLKTATVIDGKLYLNKDEGIKKMFDKDAKGNIKKADGAWGDLVESNGK